MRGYGPFFYVIEAYRGLRANSLVNLLAMGTISMGMLIVGFFLIIYLNLQAAVNAMGERLEVSVYLKEGLTAQERDYLLMRLKAEPGVKRAVLAVTDCVLMTFHPNPDNERDLIKLEDRYIIPEPPIR